MFHRLITPTYFGALPGGYDYINNPALNGDPGAPAGADAKKASGPNEGTYFVAFQEEATSLDFNRANQALAENTDIIDDILRTSVPVPDFVDATTVGAISEVVVAGDVFVGKSGTASTQDERNRLITVLDPTTNSVLTNGGVRIVATGVEDGMGGNVVGTTADGFYTGPTVTFAPDIPATTDYRIVFGKRSNLTSIADPAGDLAAFTREVIIVRTPSVTASQVTYLGGSAWLDGVTNPLTDVENQLDKTITDLTSQVATTSGANKLGIAPRTAWLGGRTNPATDIGTAVDKIIIDLSDQLAGDDGAERVGAEAHTSAGTFGIVAAGSVRSQLNDVIDLGVGVAVSNAMSNPVPFTFSRPTNTLQATAGDLILQTDSGSVIAKNTTAGGVEVENSTGDTVFKLSTAATTAPQTLVVGTGEGVATLAHGQQNVIEVQTGLNAPPGNVGRGLAIETGTSRNGASIAPYMMLRGGGLAGGSAGGPRGGFQWFWNVNEGNDERVSIMPCESQVIADGASQILTIQHDLAPPACTPKLNASTTALVEIDLCCIGDNATSPTDNFGAFKRTALVRRNIAGNYAVVGSIQDTFSAHNFDDSGSPMFVTIIAAGASWPQIQVTQAGGLVPRDALWWGTMRITVLQHTDVPDN